MGLGAVWCRADRVAYLSWKIRNLKRAHGFPSSFEIKWTKVSPAGTDFYVDLVRLFFSETSLHFRALVAHRKNELVHGAFDQTHDEWYYKMYFYLLREIIRPNHHFRVFVDQKDTRSSSKVRELRNVLCNSNLDFQRQILGEIQIVQSKQVQLVQLADLLLGAVCYSSRGLHGNAGKQSIIDEMKLHSGYKLTLTTLAQEQKLNIFHWTPQVSER